MSSIREKVARAYYESVAVGGDWDDEGSSIKHAHRDTVNTVITAFIEAAAEEGWQLVQREATEEVTSRLVVWANLSGGKATIIKDANLIWNDVLEGAPKFKVDE